ncbi:MAG: hypothetical protein ABSH16_05850 [Sedimentisphaerales bacterium]
MCDIDVKMQFLRKTRKKTEPSCPPSNVVVGDWGADTDLIAYGEKVYKIGKITAGSGNVVIKE